jgi:hypothetical protein
MCELLLTELEDLLKELYDSVDCENWCDGRDWLDEAMISSGVLYGVCEDCNCEKVDKERMFSFGEFG